MPSLVLLVAFRCDTRKLQRIVLHRPQPHRAYRAVVALSVRSIGTVFFFHSPSPDTINHGNYGAGRDVNPSRCDHRFQTEQESIRQLASETKKVAHSVVMICHGGGGQVVAGERTAPSHKSCRGRRPVSGSHCDASSWTRGGGPMHKQDEHAVLQGMSHLAGKHFALQNPPTIVSHRPSGVN